MAISLSPETQRLIEERMRQADIPSADELVRVALDALDRMGTVAEEPDDDLDDETWEAIERADAEYERGGGIPLDEAFAQLRKKYTGE
jgi:hypothetical protein